MEVKDLSFKLSNITVQNFLAVKRLDFTVIHGIVQGCKHTKEPKVCLKIRYITESENTYLWNVVQSNGQSQVDTNTKTLCLKKIYKLEILVACISVYFSQDMSVQDIFVLLRNGIEWIHYKRSKMAFLQD